MKQPEKIIIVDSLEKSYKNLKVLNGISFTIGKGSIFALLGSNGAGKTTTIKLLSTLMKPDRGSASICGFDTYTQSDKVRKHISLTGQYAAVDELLTGRENLLMIGSLRHLSHISTRVDKLLKSFNLVDASNRRVSTYSGGMRRRLDLAMSLMGDPDVIFLDEPTTGLDPQSRLSLWKVIRSLADNETTVFLTTQYLEEAEQLADHIAILHRGIIVAEGSPDKLKENFSKGIIEIKFNNLYEMEKTLKLLNSYETDSNKELLVINISTDGSTKQIADIMNLLSNANITLSGFTQKLPTLEEVFLKYVEEHTGGQQK